MCDHHQKSVAVAAAAAAICPANIDFDPFVDRRHLLTIGDYGGICINKGFLVTSVIVTK